MTSLRRSIPPLLLTLAMALPAARADDAVVNSDLNASTLYALLVAELSARNGDDATAYQVMLDAAQKSRSSQLFERAVEIALRARAGDSALQAAQAWLRAQPTSQEANRYLVQILVGLNKLPETVAPLQAQLARLSPKDRLDAIRTVPRYFARTGDKKMAAKVVEQALAPELGNPTTGATAHAAIGTMRLLAGEPAAALEWARKGAALHAQSEDPIQLALALMDSKLPAAEALVVQHLRSSSNTDLRMGYLRRLLDAQRLQDAKAEAVAINRSNPQFADAWLVRGSLAFQESNRDEARMALQTFVQLRQQNPRAGDDASTDKGLTQAYFLLADLAEQSQQWAEAERLLSQIDSPQDSMRVFGRRAQLVARQGRLDEARALIRSAPELQADDARTKLGLEVQMLREHRQYQAAYEVLKQAVSLYPGDADYAYDLAMAAEKLDKMDEMERLLRQVIAAKPDYHHAYNALGYSLADRRMRLDEARALVRKALEFAPDDPFIQDSLGWVEFRSGNLPLALEILQAAYKNRPDPEIAAHLGEVLWNLQQKDQARAIWKEAQAKSPDNDTLNETVQRLGRP